MHEQPLQPDFLARRAWTSNRRLQRSFGAQTVSQCSCALAFAYVPRRLRGVVGNHPLSDPQNDALRRHRADNDHGIRDDISRIAS